MQPSPVAVVVDELLLRIPLVDGLWVGIVDVVWAIAHLCLVGTPFAFAFAFGISKLLIRLHLISVELNSITFGFDSIRSSSVRFDSIDFSSVPFG